MLATVRQFCKALEHDNGKDMELLLHRLFHLTVEHSKGKEEQLEEKKREFVGGSTQMEGGIFFARPGVRLTFGQTISGRIICMARMLEK